MRAKSDNRHHHCEDLLNADVHARDPLIAFASSRRFAILRHPLRMSHPSLAVRPLRYVDDLRPAFGTERVTRGLGRLGVQPVHSPRDD